MDSAGKIIAYYRKLRGLSQKVLAEKVGCREKTISHFENDRYPPSPGTVAKIAKALQIPAVDRKRILIMRDERLKAAWPGNGKETIRDYPNDEIIAIAQRQGLIPKALPGPILQALRTWSTFEGTRFTSPKQVKVALEEITERFPELKLKLRACELVDNALIDDTDVKIIISMLETVIAERGKARHKS